MQRITERTWGALRRYLGTGDGTDRPTEVAPLALSGQQAALVVETGLGSTSMAGGAHSVVQAVGAALAGTRSAAFVEREAAAPWLAALEARSGEITPLVVHADQQDLHASPTGSWIHLAPSNAQEVADLTLAARCIAELALMPVVLQVDPQRTGACVQDVRLPTSAMINAVAGLPQDTVESPTPAQQLLFGPTRRRLPRWFDLQGPLLIAANMGRESGPLALCGRQPFVADHVPETITRVLGKLGDHTGRPYAVLSANHARRADVLVVAQGATADWARHAVHWLQRQRQKVGLVTLRCLRPFPAAELASALRGHEVIVVLESADAPLLSEPPLLSAVRNCVAQHLASERAQPRLLSALCGTAGALLRTADLLSLVHGARTHGRSQVYLDARFADGSTDSPYPKRQLALDSLLDAYPTLRDRALDSTQPADAKDDTEGVGVLVCRRRDDAQAQALHASLGQTLHQLRKGTLRGHVSTPADNEVCALDSLYWSAEDRGTPGDDRTVDLVVFCRGAGRLRYEHIERLRDGGTLLLETLSDGQPHWEKLTPRLLHLLRQRRVSIYRTTQPDSAAERTEGLLGSAVALLAASWSEVTPRRARATRETLLELDGLPRATVQAHASVFASHYEQQQPVAVPEATTTIETSVATHFQLPLAVQHVTAVPEPIKSLPQFWDQIGVLYRTGETDQLVVDPRLTAGVVPSLTATFRDLSTERERLPEIDHQRCTGCGACWVHCPDAAIAPVALAVETLIEAGINRAKAAGDTAEALRMASKKLAQRATRALSKSEEAAANASKLLEPAFEWLVQRLELDPQRLHDLQHAFAACNKAVGGLPIARTDPLFDAAERINPGTGELLSLAVNADACKGCGICAAVCEPDAINILPDSPSRTETARRHWALWEHLPDSPATTIERLAANGTYDTAAALLLSRHCLLAMGSGDSAEPGSGPRMALHLALAAIELTGQRRATEHLEAVSTERERLAGHIRTTLADALPTGDLDAMAEGLAALGKTNVDVAAIAARLDQACQANRVDAARLQRVVDVGRGLADIHWQCTRGHNGLGRARYGIVLCRDESTRWATCFPDNVFAVPATVADAAQAADLCQGLIQGQLDQVLRDFDLLRTAKLEIEAPQKAALPQYRPSGLSYEDLTGEERRRVPPLLLVGSEESLGGAGMAGLLALLAAHRPIKIIVLADVGRGLVRHDRNALDLALLAIARRHSFVLQSSVGYADHLARGLQRALAFDGPALIRICTPSPSRDGFDATQTVAMARLAVGARVCPLLQFDPRTGDGLGSCLDLADNPQAQQDWADDEALTPMSWARAQQRFAEHFETEPGQAEPQAVGPRLAAWADECLQRWRTLQELAGVKTPFTGRIEQEVQRQLGESHAMALSALRQQHQQELGTLRTDFENEALERLTQRLLSLAGFDAKDNPSDHSLRSLSPATHDSETTSASRPRQT